MATSQGKGYGTQSILQGPVFPLVCAIACDRYGVQLYMCERYGVQLYV